MRRKRDGRSKSRRKVLKISGASLASVGFVGNAIAKNGNGPEVNTEFNPENEKQVSEFISNLVELKKTRQEKIYKTLSEKQKEVVAEGLKLDSVQVESAEVNDGVSTTSGAYTRSLECILKGQSTAGENIWNYHHKLTWEFDDFDCPTISDPRNDVRQKTWATNISLGWSYDGEASSSKGKESSPYCGDQASSFAQAKFTYALNGGVWTANPRSTLKGGRHDTDGDGLAEETDTWVKSHYCDYCDGWDN